MEIKLPRILFTAPKSGDGKTTVTCAVLGAFVNRKLNPSAFKCGPDYIDPLFHKEIIGADSGNLDLFFTDENTCKYLLYSGAKNSKLSVLEGAMGFYDGVAGKTDMASAYHVAKVTRTPVVLVLDAKGCSLSICATIKGFLSFREDSNIKGVILNRCSKMQYSLLKRVIEEKCGVAVFGFLPYEESIALESRHLGLVTAAEVEDIKKKINTMANMAEEYIDLNGILILANNAPDLAFDDKSVASCVKSKPVIAVARDKAFCFYYRENLEILKDLGAEVVEFSPLRDETLPEGANAIYFGGGYPELHAEQLSQNTSMLCSIKNSIDAGMPVFAECGGYMYLLSSLKDDKNREYSFVNSLANKSHYTGKLGRFGYIRITANEDNMLCKKGDSIHAHEFHYYDSNDNGTSFTGVKPITGRSWQCIHAKDNLFAGYPHLYFYSNINFAVNFVKAAEEYKSKL